jgi:hypothetical protein
VRTETSSGSNSSVRTVLDQRPWTTVAVDRGRRNGVVGCGPELRARTDGRRGLAVRDPAGSPCCGGHAGSGFGLDPIVSFRTPGCPTEVPDRAMHGCPACPCRASGSRHNGNAAVHRPRVLPIDPVARMHGPVGERAGLRRISEAGVPGHVDKPPAGGPGQARSVPIVEQLQQVVERPPSVGGGTARSRHHRSRVQSIPHRRLSTTFTPATVSALTLSGLHRSRITAPAARSVRTAPLTAAPAASAGSRRCAKSTDGSPHRWRWRRLTHRATCHCAR